jgi:hypothetical protein
MTKYLLLHCNQRMTKYQNRFYKFQNFFLIIKNKSIYILIIIIYQNNKLFDSKLKSLNQRVEKELD